MNEHNYAAILAALDRVAHYSERSVTLNDARLLREAMDIVREYRRENILKDSALCPHGYPQTVRCTRCGE